jgi:malate dehydrogenase
MQCATNTGFNTKVLRSYHDYSKNYNSDVVVIISGFPKPRYDLEKVGINGIAKSGCRECFANIRQKS